MDKLLYAAHFMILPNNIKLHYLKTAIDFLDCRDNAMSIIPNLNEDLRIKIDLIKQTFDQIEIRKLIQEGDEILSKIHSLRPRLMSLSHKVRQIPEQQYYQVRKLIYLVRVEKESIYDKIEQIKSLSKLYKELKDLKQANYKMISL